MIYYIITDGRGNYIRKDLNSGKYISIKSKDMAIKFEHENKAKNVLGSCLSKNLKSAFFVKCIDDGNMFDNVKESQKEPQKEPNPTKDKHIKYVNKLSEEDIDNGQLDKWESGVDKLSDFLLDVENRIKELASMESTVDKEIVDIQHYIEFNDLNACQGFMAYKMLQHRLRRRRKIKNELYVLGQFGDCKINRETLNSVKSEITKIEHKKYVPRVLSGLFD